MLDTGLADWRNREPSDGGWLHIIKGRNERQPVRRCLVVTTMDFTPALKGGKGGCCYLLIRPVPAQPNSQGRTG